MPMIQPGPAECCSPVNPDVFTIAGSLDENRSGSRRPLEGIPILLKDNIATGDAQHTTAGSLALADAHAHRDATVVKRLRQAGAVILGKANLTEFASVLTVGMPGGYSSVAGQVRNPYAPQLDEKGIPIVNPGGSSSGSAVAVAAGFAAAAIGTETSGSLLSPANQNGVVTVKPTVGLISCAGVVPIDRSQDTVGPLTRTVRDAATLLNVLVAPDPEDDATLSIRRPVDYRSVLDKEGLRGARIGIPIRSSGGILYEQLAPGGAAAVMREAYEALEDLGATLVRATLEIMDWSRDFDADATVLKLYPGGLTGHQMEQLPIFLPVELKQSLNAYLRDWAKGTSMQTMEDVIAFNAANTDRALRFGQTIFLAAEQPHVSRIQLLTRKGGVWTFAQRTRARLSRSWTVTGSTRFVSGIRGRRARRKSRLSECSRSGWHDLGRRFSVDARLPIRRHVHGTCLGRTSFASFGLRL